MAEFRVWEEGDGMGKVEGRTIEAYDAEHAAELWAEMADHLSAEYYIVSQTEKPIVCVRSADGEVSRWRVRGEAVPAYYAEQVEG